MQKQHNGIKLGGWEWMCGGMAPAKTGYNNNKLDVIFF